MSDDRWTWGKGDVQWSRGKKPAAPLLDAEGIKIAEENLRRIRAGEPLLNGQSPHPVKGGAKPDDEVQEGEGEP